MSAETIELANNYTQKRFVDLVRNNIVNGYRNTCADPKIVIHVATHNINLYILITNYQFIYSNYITNYYYVHVTIVF